MKKILLATLLTAMSTGLFAQGSGTAIADYKITWGTPKAVDLHGNQQLNLLFGGWQAGAATSGYFENTDGVFTQKWLKDANYFGGQYTTNAFGDLNGDGEIDVITTCHNSGPTRFLLGNGDGTFTLGSDNDYPVTAGQTNSLKGAAIADFNNDGLMDYLVARVYTNPGDVDEFGEQKFHSAVIFFQQENGSFVEDKTTFPTVLQGQAINVKTVDYNNDGFVDVIISSGKEWGGDQNETRSFNMFKNDGTGHFTLDAQPDIIEKWGGFDLADIDGDGWLDLIVGGFVRGTGTDGQQWGHNGLSEPDSWYCRIYKNNNGVFEDTEKYIYPFKPVKKGDVCRLVDFDNDGKLDIVLCGTTDAGTTESPTVINLYRGTDPATFSFNTTGELLVTVGWTDMEVADLDGDGKLDIVTAGYGPEPIAGEKAYVTWNTTALIGNTAPTAPANPNTGITSNTVTFSWDAATDTETPNSLTYNLALKNKTTGKWLYYPMAYMENGFRRIAAPGNVSTNKSWTLTLPDGEYEWAVQAIDANCTGGAFTETKSFVVPGTTTGIFENLIDGVKLFQNNGLIEIRSAVSIQKMSLFSINGELVKASFASNKMNVTDLSQGAYILKINTEIGEKTFKILK